MEKNNYSVTINVNADPDEAFKKISQVNLWWAKNFIGKAVEEGDTFKVDFGKTFVDFKVTEAVPGQRIVWLVTDCYLHWIENKREWNQTEVVWEISRKDGGSQIKMTHVGLVPTTECYNDCEAGWNGHIKESLVTLINENRGKPE
jgi:hypothetical protein